MPLLQEKRILALLHSLYRERHLVCNPPGHKCNIFRINFGLTEINFQAKQAVVSHVNHMTGTQRIIRTLCKKSGKFRISSFDKGYHVLLRSHVVQKYVFFQKSHSSFLLFLRTADDHNIRDSFLRRTDQKCHHSLRLQFHL